VQVVKARAAVVFERQVSRMGKDHQKKREVSTNFMDLVLGRSFRKRASTRISD
jgi:hypothetical protein